jgi:hypothetical protein
MRLLPLVLLLAAMASPVIGAPRPLESLRLVVAIQWLSEEETAVEAPVTSRPAAALAPLTSRVSPFGAPDARPRVTGLERSTFQRPPPPVTSLHS